jgi:acyl transferase domain-containing protein
MRAFVFSGLNSLFQSNNRNSYFSLPETQKAFEQAQLLLKNKFQIDIDFNRLSQASPEVLYSLENINLVTTMIVCVQVAVARALLQREITPDILSSVSLGDVARSIISGAVAFDDAIQIANVNAQERLGLDQLGESIALVTSEADPITAIDEDYFLHSNIGASQLSLNLWNLAGSHKDIEQLRKYASARNWRIRHMLNYPFHSPVMSSYAQSMKQFLSKVHLQEAQITMFSSTFIRKLNSQKDLFEEQMLTMTHAHHWKKSVDVMTTDLGVSEFINIGPCQTLTRALAENKNTIKIINAIDLLGTTRAH